MKDSLMNTKWQLVPLSHETNAIKVDAIQAKEIILRITNVIPVPAWIDNLMKMGVLIVDRERAHPYVKFNGRVIGQTSCLVYVPESETTGSVFTISLEAFELLFRKTGVTKEAEA